LAILETVEGGVERAFFDPQEVVRRALDPLRDGVAVHGPPAHRFQDEEVEGSPENFEFRHGHEAIAFLCLTPISSKSPRNARASERLMLAEAGQSLGPFGERQQLESDSLDFPTHHRSPYVWPGPFSVLAGPLSQTARCRVVRRIS